MVGKVLVVEDEEAIRGMMKLYLENKSFGVLTASNGDEALDAVKKEAIDIILLDIEMPDMDGFEVCKRIRTLTNIPIIFVSSRRSVADKVQSLQLGGDDYMTKPFDFEELEARIHANLRRNMASQKNNEKNVIKVKELVINLDNFECYLKGERLNLSTKETEILIVLAKKTNRVWSSEKLYDHIWGIDSFGDIQTIKVHISNIRRKIDKILPGEVYIETVRGFGYKISN